MKCVVVLYGLRGGAPRSLLQHIKVLKQNGYDEIVCLVSGGDEALLNEYRNEVSSVVLQTTSVELWDNGKRWEAYQAYRREYAFLRKENPQLVVALGGINGAFYTYFCKKTGIPCIVYIAGGDQNISENVIDLWDQCEAICFSKENETFIHKHFSPDHTHVISNRIAPQKPFTDIITHYREQSVTNLLIVSRLDDDKIKSIYSVLKIASECASENNRIAVRIAGEGSKEEALRAFCNTMEKPFLSIKILGHVDRLADEFRWAHIVAGKGRSVIEPIMMNRIGCIIGEDGKICFCDSKNFENLYFYNFSGRNLLIEDSMSEMSKMLKRIKDGAIQEKDLLETAEIVRKYYSAEYLPEQLCQVLSKIPSGTLEKGHAFLFVHYLRVLAKKVVRKVNLT